MNYDENSTLKLFWNINDKTRFGMYCNPYTTSINDPEINATIAARDALQVSIELIRIHNFDPVADDVMIKKIFRILKPVEGEDGGLENYLGFVETNEAGEFSDFYISPKKTDPDATFNMNTRTWDLPSNHFEIIKNRKIEELKSARNSTIESEGAPYNNLHFWADKGSKSDIHFAITAYDKFNILPQLWKAKDGVLLNPTIEDLMGIATAVGGFIESQFVKENVLLTQLNAATTVEELRNITW